MLRNFRVNSKIPIMRRCVLVGWALVSAASGQQPNGGASCEAGTPIRFGSEGVWGYLTPSGIKIQPQFKIAGRFSSGVAAACTEDGCGLINTDGKLTTPLWEPGKDNLAKTYSEGLGSITKGGKEGYADLSGEIVIPPTFEYAGDFSSGVARVRLNRKEFFINRKGERVTPEFAATFDFSEGLAAVIVGQQVGYIALNGAFVIPPTYSGTSGIQFSEGLVAARIGGKVGFMNKSGSVVVPPAYDDAYPFSEGLAPVQVENVWGYIDKTGRLVIPIKYQVASMFTEGVAAVTLADKSGYIDHRGNFIIAPTFDGASPFCAGLASVVTNQHTERVPDSNCWRSKGRTGLIDHSGSYVWRDLIERLTFYFCG
jgi:hypothetical protein